MKMKHENHTRTIENQSRRSHENVQRNFSLLISHSPNAWGGGGTIKPASVAGNNLVSREKILLGSSITTLSRVTFHQSGASSRQLHVCQVKVKQVN